MVIRFQLGTRHFTGHCRFTTKGKVRAKDSRRKEFTIQQERRPKNGLC